MKPINLLFLFSLFQLFTVLLCTFTGDGTVYTNGFTNPDGGSGYNCGFRWLPTKARTYFAALNAPQYANSENCGRCASVKCVDPKCKSTKTITVMIVDQCPECLSGSLDFSTPAWNDITGISPNRVKISWDFVPCTNMVDTTQAAKLAIKDGSNRWWFAFQVSNTVNAITLIRVLSGSNWISLARQKYGFWVGTSSSGVTLPIVVEATDSTGKKYSKTLSSINGNTVVDF